MILKEVARELDELFKISTAECFDNAGLLCGNSEREVTGILITHDALEEVIEEAVARKTNLVVAFHPVIFSGLKSVTGKNYVEKAVLKAIENQIAIYAVHTAFDNDYYGVSYGLAEKLGLRKQRILIPKKKNLHRLDVYVPSAYVEAVRDAILAAGAGNIGFYKDCSFSVSGLGTFTPKAHAKPFTGESEVRSYVEEQVLSFVFEVHKKNEVLNAMYTAHPYEEVAYQVFLTENENHYLGFGRYGYLEKELGEKAFLGYVRETLGLRVIRYSGVLNKKIKKVAVLGGSGALGILAAHTLDCDAYLTGDLKYHDFFLSEKKMLLCDIGHFESERWVVDQLFERISEKFSKFAVLKGRICTNPVNYFFKEHD
ncbi:MAG: Nif3-like dinuclear metal center hexameric protein [Bergeyella sp.]|nr:Nif3-like dinuclear metal center hexameric protein [Bergeyella sp.]